MWINDSIDAPVKFARDIPAHLLMLLANAGVETAIALRLLKQASEHPRCLLMHLHALS
jgi:hypothetical protein